MARKTRRDREFVDLDSIYLTTRDLEILFGVSRVTIWHWRKAKGLPYEEVRGFRQNAVRYDYSDVVEWAKENRQPIVGRSTLREALAEQGQESGAQ